MTRDLSRCALGLLVVAAGCSASGALVSSAPPDDEAEEFVDSILGHPSAVVAFVRRQGRRFDEEYGRVGDFKLVRAGFLSWKTVKGRDGVNGDFALLAAILLDADAQRQHILLADVYSTWDAVNPIRSWIAFEKPFEAAIIIAPYPVDSLDRGLVRGYWGSVAGDSVDIPKTIGVHVNREAWMAFLGFAPPFNRADYVEHDPDMHEP